VQREEERQPEKHGIVDELKEAESERIANDIRDSDSIEKADGSEWFLVITTRMRR
jgi:hypothetical protein